VGRIGKMKIDEKMYFRGRDSDYANECTEVIRDNAKATIAAANYFLRRYEESTGDVRPRMVTSGWRPKSVNAKVSPAFNSKHITAQAIDIADGSEALDTWAMTKEGLETLEEAGLYLEHPSKTEGWCHVQIVPPGSRKRVFYP
jgi:hypothetical protein